MFSCVAAECGIVDAWETKGQIAMLNGNTGYFWLVCASCEKCMLYFWTPLTASECS